MAKKKATRKKSKTIRLRTSQEGNEITQAREEEAHYVWIPKATHTLAETLREMGCSYKIPKGKIDCMGALDFTTEIKIAKAAVILAVEEEKPSIYGINQALKMVLNVVEKAWQLQGVVTRLELFELMQYLSGSINMHVTDKETKAKIMQDWAIASGKFMLR